MYSSSDTISLARDAIIVMLQIGAPIMVIALAVGLVISLVQALTQIQEMTLTFVPKILIIFISLIFLMPFMLSTLVGFTRGLMDAIVAGG